MIAVNIHIPKRIPTRYSAALKKLPRQPKTMQKPTTTITSTLLTLITALFMSAATADSFYRIQNHWKPNQEINLETGAPTSSPTKPGWWSADWILEPTGEPGHVRLKNRWKGTYLNVENGSLQATAIKPGWWSAMWRLEPASQGLYRIRNKWKPNDYLNIEHGRLEASAIKPGWWSAKWRIQDASGRQYAQADGSSPSSSANPAPKAAIGVSANSALGRQILASPGKQCVKAKFGIGYAATVRWYEPQNVEYTPKTGALNITPGASAYKTEKIAVLQTSCVQTNKKMVAQISVIGGDIANEAITLAAGTAVAVGSGVAGAFVCVGTVGAGCPAAVAGVSAAVGGSVSAVGMALPDAKDTFYIGSPGKLELAGTVWEPSYEEVREFGKGKPAGARCDSDGECANDTCARESAADGNRSICCPSGKEGMFAAREYCYGMKRGTICKSDAMCASGNCAGNASGLRNGVCD